MNYTVSFNISDTLLDIFGLLKNYTKKVNLICNSDGISISHLHTNKTMLIVSNISKNDLQNYSFQSETIFSFNLQNLNILSSMKAEEGDIFSYVDDYEPLTWVIELQINKTLTTIFRFTEFPIVSPSYVLNDYSWDYQINYDANELFKLCSNMKKNLTIANIIPTISFHIKNNKFRIIFNRENPEVEAEICINLSVNYTRSYMGLFDMDLFISVLSSKLGSSLILHFKEDCPLYLLFNRGLTETKIHLLPITMNDIQKDHY